LSPVGGYSAEYHMNRNHLWTLTADTLQRQFSDSPMKWTDSKFYIFWVICSKLLISLLLLCIVWAWTYALQRCTFSMQQFNFSSNQHSAIYKGRVLEPGARNSGTLPVLLHIRGTGGISCMSWVCVNWIRIPFLWLRILTDIWIPSSFPSPVNLQSASNHGIGIWVQAKSSFLHFESVEFRSCPPFSILILIVWSLMRFDLISLRRMRRKWRTNKSFSFRFLISIPFSKFEVSFILEKRSVGGRGILAVVVLNVSDLRTTYTPPSPIFFRLDGSSALVKGKDAPMKARRHAG